MICHFAVMYQSSASDKNRFRSYSRHEQKPQAYAHKRQSKAKVSGDAEIKENKAQSKRKLNITLREDAKQKLTALAELEKRSLSNLIEVMAYERWEKLAEREGVDYAKTIAEIAGLKGLSADNKADRRVFRRELLERVLKFKRGST